MTDRIAKGSPRLRARIAGGFYLLTFVTGALALFFAGRKLEQYGDAANLLSTDDAHLFGDNEFKIRSIALKIAAKAYEQHLARKKTDTKGPA